MPTAGIFLFPGADELDVVGPFRVFRAAQMLVHLVAEAVEPVRLGNGLVVEPTHTFADCPPLDVFLAPGGSSDSEEAGRRVQQRNPEAIAFIQRAAKDAQLTASVCTGAFLLAEAGLLDGRRANTHWMHRDELRRLMASRGQPIELVSERVVWDGGLVTAGGVTSGIDLGLEVVGRLLGDKARELVAAGLERETPPG